MAHGALFSALTAQEIASRRMNPTPTSSRSMICWIVLIKVNFITISVSTDPTLTDTPMRATVDIYCAISSHIAGIGTFDTDSSGSGLGWFARLKASIAQTIDQAIGTTFEYHVSAGYKFLMRFYSPGDAIYLFGFSRGAYTARFLAEMINVAGLLSQGNEDMVRFAFSSFSEVQRHRGKVNKTGLERSREKYLETFKRTFCRPNVKVHFLGLFDCVNSVGQFEVPFRKGSYRYIATVRMFPFSLLSLFARGFLGCACH